MLCLGRRDFTINSLFYNINTRSVEDFTGKGLDDLLEHRMIRTPLPAEDTFRDGIAAFEILFGGTASMTSCFPWCS